jgi:hypothetical protein
MKLSGLGRTHSRLGLMERVRVKYLDADLAPGFPEGWWFEYDGRAVRLMQGFTDMLFGRGLTRRTRGLAAVLANVGKRIRRQNET